MLLVPVVKELNSAVSMCVATVNHEIHAALNSCAFCHNIH